jgi:hypothetical protein
MADNDTNKDKSELDFDSGSFDWGDDSADNAAAAASTGRSSLGDDDPFSAAGDDDGFSSDSFYSMEQLPDADGSDSFGDLGGSDFDDITTDDGAENYDFGSESDDLPAGRVITDGFGSDDDGSDPFSNSGADDDVATSDDVTSEDEEAVDPFAQPSGDEEEADQEEAVKPAKSAFKTYLLGAVAAMLVAAGGFVYVMPSIMGGDADVEVAQNQPPQDPISTFPASLPAQDTAQQEAPSEIAVAVPPLATPSIPNVETNDTAPPALTIPELPVSAPVADTPALEIPSSPVSVEVAAPVLAENDPLADLVGGKERGGIDAMKESKEIVIPESSPEPKVSSQEVAALASRLEALEAKVDRLADSFDNLVETPVKAGTPVDFKPSAPITVGSDLVPPLKPAVFEDVILKGVAGDVAWVSTKSGVVEVKVGDEVPGVGKVVSFRNYRGDWIVVTTDGLIVRQ